MGKDVTVLALDNMLSAYYQGKQIALHKLSYNKKDIIVNKEHYRKMIIKQSFDTENTLLHNQNLIDFNVNSPELSVYDEVIGGEF